MLKNIIKENNMTIYKLSQLSGVPYTTVSELCRGKTNLAKCKAETIYKLSKALNVTMEMLLAPSLEKRPSFDLFKSNICHQVKEMGDISFIVNILSNNVIRQYFDRGWFRESFYVLAMLDYLSRVNQVPICKEYNDIRAQKLQEPIYPSSVLVANFLTGKNEEKEKAEAEAIPEFMRFNLVESDVRNVI